LRHVNAEAAVLSVQTSCNGRPCEGFVVSRGEQLPLLQPNQVTLYSDRCSAVSDRQPVSTVLPHEQFAKSLAAYIPTAGAGVPYAWKALESIQGGVQ
jgi:hypothetical protein